MVVRRNDDISLAEIDALAPQKIVISPGPCTPSESGISLDVIHHYAGKLPILGVCLGHQAIGQVFGATIVRSRQSDAWQNRAGDPYRHGRVYGT